MALIIKDHMISTSSASYKTNHGRPSIVQYLYEPFERYQDRSSMLVATYIFFGNKKIGIVIYKVGQ